MGKFNWVYCMGILVIINGIINGDISYRNINGVYNGVLYENFAGDFVWGF